jgi:hypothetical protein
VLKYGPNNIPPFVIKLLSREKRKSLGNRLNDWLELCSYSLSANGWARYSAAWSWYKDFCKDAHKARTVPLSKPRTRQILLWNYKEKRVSSKTAEVYLSAIKFIGKLVTSKGGKLENRFLLRGGKNRENLSAKKVPVLPMTLEALNRFGEFLASKRWNAINKKMVWTCALVAFWGAFRIGELLAKNKWEFDPFSDLSWSDVKIRKNRLEIRIKSPKTGGRVAVSRMFAVDEKDFCAVRAMRRLKILQQSNGTFSKNAPVFRVQSGKNLTRRKFGKMVRDGLGNLKMGHYGGKSFRAGVPTELEFFPELATDLHIKNWGHWRSNAYQLCMKNDLIQQEWIFKKFSREILNRFTCRGISTQASQAAGSHLQRLGR